MIDEYGISDAMRGSYRGGSPRGKIWVRPEGWQPISTAPKDGTEILSYVQGGVYEAGTGTLADPAKTYEKFKTYEVKNYRCIAIYENGMWFDGDERFDPDCWAPLLPEPPEDVWL